jgi:D-alanyl-D-alanine carboxypeptidase (penicillin-binding protein 5/6)
MTVYVVFSRIREGAISLADEVLVSEKAWRTGGSRMFIRVDTRVSVDNLLKGVIVQSGNDASVALAEHVAGSEEGFAQAMNETAAKIGLTGSHFRNATGLPHPEHYSTARDLTLLASALVRDFPELYEMYSIREFTWNNITQRNRNVLLGRDDSVDGVKTGHTSSAGYCLIGSARRDGRRLIATVIGTDSPRYRADAVYSLLQHGFAAYEGHRVYGPGVTVTEAKVYKGAQSTVPAGFVNGLHVTVAQGRSRGLSARIAINEPLIAPIRAGDEIGQLTLMVDGGDVAGYPLVALDGVEPGSWLGNLVDSVRLMLF